MKFLSNHFKITYTCVYRGSYAYLPYHDHMTCRLLPARTWSHTSDLLCNTTASGRLLSEKEKKQLHISHVLIHVHVLIQQFYVLYSVLYIMSFLSIPNSIEYLSKFKDAESGMLSKLPFTLSVRIKDLARKLVRESKGGHSDWFICQAVRL